MSTEGYLETSKLEETAGKRGFVLYPHIAYNSVEYKIMTK